MTYQGSRFRLGRGQTFFAIWPSEAPLEHPTERWPATPEGWSAAWSRFNELETPGTIAPVAPVAPVAQPAKTNPAKTKPAATALPGLRVTNSAALLVIGVVFGAVGLFPSYFSGSKLISQPALLVPHVLYLAVWAVAAVGVLLGGGKARVAALLGLGASTATFGIFVADLGQTVSGTTAGAGLILACIGWLACTAGSVLALRSLYSWRELVARPRGAAIGVVVMLGVAAAGLAATFAPAWDSYLLRTSAGQSETITAGNVFSQPWLMIVGNVAVMVAIVLVAVLAGLWRSPRLGAVLLLGAIVPMAAQAVSALIQKGEATSPTIFGISSSQASSAGLTITNGLTTSFWLYCVFLVALLISCAWMLLSPARPVPQSARPVPQSAGPVLEGAVLTGESVFATPAAEAHPQAGDPQAGDSEETQP
jgi:hypothetical protein